MAQECPDVLDEFSDGHRTLRPGFAPGAYRFAFLATTDLSADSIAGGCTGKLLYFFLGDMEPRVCGGDTSVNGGLKKNLFDIAYLQAMQKSRLHVETKLLPASKGYRHCQNKKTTSSVVEARSPPDRSPRVSGD